MAFYLEKYEDLKVGPSAALNVAGAVKIAQTLEKGKTIVTILCDSSERYQSKILNPEWLKQMNLSPSQYILGEQSYKQFL